MTARGFVFVFLVLLVGLPAAEPQREIPSDGWVKIFFGEIDRVTTAASLAPLRLATLPAGDREIRLWAGFGLGPLRGYVIRRESGQWSGRALQPDRDAKSVETQLLRPRATWDEAWEALCAKRLLTLPDFSTLPQSNYVVTDGVGFVVEVFWEGRYRTYNYSNPSSFDNPECREMEAMLATFRREFLGGDGKVNVRSFLSAIEIRQIGSALQGLSFPIEARAFFEALPVKILERGLHANGTSGLGSTWWSEYALTARSDPKGYYALICFLGKTSSADHAGEFSIRHAEVAFRDRELEQPLVLQPEDYPEKRAPVPRSR